MKAEVLKVGNYVEGSESGVILEGWQVNSDGDREPLSLSDLKELAIDAGTYTQREGAILDEGNHGVRWYGDSPFGD